nr:MAG TPA: hypothetical protein [Caudoviricetes sp.]
MHLTINKMVNIIKCFKYIKCAMRLAKSPP